MGHLILYCVACINSEFNSCENKDIVEPFRLVKDLLINTPAREISSNVSATAADPARPSSFAADTFQSQNRDRLQLVSFW